jgi:hypothetical protein
VSEGSIHWTPGGVEESWVEVVGDEDFQKFGHEVTINHARRHSTPIVVQRLTLSRQIVHVAFVPSIWQWWRVLDFVLHNMRFTSRIVHVSALPPVVQRLTKSINLVCSWSSTFAMPVRFQVTPATVLLDVFLRVTKIDTIPQTSFWVRVVLFHGSVKHGFEGISERVASCP